MDMATDVVIYVGTDTREELRKMKQKTQQTFDGLIKDLIQLRKRDELINKTLSAKGSNELKEN